MKKLLSACITILLALACCACTSDPGTAASEPEAVDIQPKSPAQIAEKMRSALIETPCGQARVVVDMALALDAGEQGILELSTTTTTDMTISQEPVSGYTVTTVDVDFGGEKSQTVTENYTVMEDGEAVAYIQSSGIWLRMPKGQTPENYAHSASSVSMNGSNLAIDETVTEWGGTQVICLTTQLTGQDMQDVLGGALNNFGTELFDSSVVSAADYSCVTCDSRIYLNKETYLPVYYEMIFTGMNDVLNPMLAQMGMRASVTKCTASSTFLSYDAQVEATLPEGAKEKAVVWERLLAGDPDNGDGTFTIREGMVLVDIAAPEGFELIDADYDHVYFKRDDNREIRYTMWHSASNERFLYENDSRLNRYGNLPRDISREQMTLTGATLTFEADILGVTWESYEEGVMNAWALLGNDGADYHIFVEVYDGYNDGLGGVKSADVTPDEFMAYLNAITISDLVSE